MILSMRLINQFLPTNQAEYSYMIDNVIYQQTPEGVEIALKPAGILPRAGAWLIDFLIRLGLIYAIGSIINVLGNFGVGLLFLTYFLLDWFYPVFFEVFFQGQTIGKKRMGILVCQDDGTPIRWQASMTRNLLRVADFLPFAFLAGIVAILSNDSAKRLGDWVAGTMVVYVDKQQIGYEIPIQNPQMLPMPLQLDEQQAILAFAERSPHLPRERAFELANILTPVSNQNHQDMPQQIIGFANTIIGRQIVSETMDNDKG